MTTKLIKFQSPTYDSGTDDANTLVLGTGTSFGVYPKTGAGITAGRALLDGTANNVALAYSAGDPAVPSDPRFGRTTVRFNVSDPKYIRINRAAGTFPMKIQGIVQIGEYATSSIKVLNADGSLIYQQGAQVADNSVGASQIQMNTDGSYGAVNRTDAGISVTTTGAYFFVGADATTGFAQPLTVIEFDDGVASARAGYRVVSGYPATNTIPLGTALTPALVLQAITATGTDTTDGDGTTVTLGINTVKTGAAIVSGGSAVQSGGTVTFSSLILRPVTSLLGTLGLPATAGLATFADLRLRYQ